MAKRVRDNAYYLNRVAKEAPAIYARYRAGDFKNPTEAIRAAGVKTPAKPINALLRAWKAASAAERAAFARAVGWSSVPTPSVTSPSAPAGSSVAPSSRGTPASAKVPIYDSELRLTKVGSARIRDLMDKHNLENSDVMRAIGYNPFDTSLMMAFARGTRMKQNLLEKLQDWVDKR